MLATDLMARLDDCKRAQFASFVYTAKGTGEKAKHVLILNATTENLYLKDVEELTTLLAASTSELERLVIGELLDSRNESLTKGIGNNSQYTCKDAYTSTAVRNVKIHIESGELHISGLSLSKEVIIPGTYKSVKSSEKTIAKNKIRKQLSSEKFRQFAIANILAVRLNGEILEVEVME